MHTQGSTSLNTCALLHSVAATDKTSITRKRQFKATDLARAAATLDDSVFIGHWLQLDPQQEIVELIY